MAEFLWTVPTRGISPALTGPRFDPSVTDERRDRFDVYDDMTQVARAAELAGFDGITIPFDPQGEDSWIAASLLARETPRLRIVPEFQPGFGTAVYAAKLSLSFQRFFADRLGWKLALTIDEDVQRTLGDFAGGADAVRRAEELLVIAAGVWHDGPFTYRGEFFEVEGGGFFDPTPSPAVQGGQNIARRPFPTVYLDGTSDDEIALSARFADVHLFDLADIDQIRGAIDRHRRQTDALGRTVRYGLRLGVVARDSAAEAWRHVERLWAGATAQPEIAVDERRADELVWTGFPEVGVRATVGLVGSFDDVAARITSYIDAGVSTFVLDSTPNLQAAYPIGEYLLPLVRREPASV